MRRVDLGVGARTTLSRSAPMRTSAARAHASRPSARRPAMAAAATVPQFPGRPVTWWWLIALGLALVPMTGCGLLRPKPSVTVQVQGDARMNFVNERPNAAVVRVYQLTARANFDRASRAALWRDDSSALGGELVTKNELMLLPDAQESLKLRLLRPRGRRVAGGLPGEVEQETHSRAAGRTPARGSVVRRAHALTI